MKDTNVMVGTKKVASFLLIAGFAFMVTCGAPLSAFAAEITTKTMQVLPPPTTGGITACPSVEVSSFVPYIYDRNLNSFEFSVSDPSYVAVAGAVGDFNVPIQFMNRRVDSSGKLLYHIDTPSIPATNDLTIGITMLSVESGQVLCASTVMISLGNTSATSTSSNTASGANPVAKAYPTKHTTSSSSGSAKAHTSKNTASAGVHSATSSSQTQSIGYASSTSVIGSLKDTLNSVCSADGGATRLWIVLLIVYIFSIIVVLLAQDPTPVLKTQTFLTSSIILPLIVLLGFWYFVPICRSGPLIPSLAIGSAVVGYIAGMRKDPKVAHLLVAKNPR